MTMDVIAEFEMFLEDRAFDVLERQKRRMTDEQYSQDRLALVQNIAAGACGFLSRTGQEVYRSSQFDPKNKAAIELLYLRLKYGNPGCPEVTRQFAEEYIEANFEKALEAAMKELTPDPNSQGPSEATGGDGSESKPSSPD